jgi:DNA processing protein
MLGDDVLVIVLAGGAGERLAPLTRERAKPAVYFGGPYRIIDFVLSNCINSGLRHIFIATQYKSLSLNRHVRRGWTVVSGGAFGIDAAAHRAALTAGGLTVAVLACGVDRPYPAGNAAMFERIAESGLLMSEWPPGSEPLRHRFLIRNRVIAAATVGTVIVEAAARSGAVQTLSRTVALGRRAMVVPGPVTSAMSVGCHELLRRQPETVVVTSAAHVLEEVGRIGEYLAEIPRGREHTRDDLDEDSALVLEAMPRRGTIGPEDLAAKAGLGIRTVLRRLSLLEMAGLVVRRDNGVALARPVRKAPP